MMSRHAHTPVISALRTSGFTRLFVVPLTVVTLLSGCTKWATWGGPDALHSSRELPDQARVTYETAGVERTVTLQFVSVVDDSLIGAVITRERRSEDVEDPPRERFAVSLTDITRVEKRQKDAGWTTFAILASIAVAAVATWQIVEAINDIDMDTSFFGDDWW